MVLERKICSFKEIKLHNKLTPYLLTFCCWWKWWPYRLAGNLVFKWCFEGLIVPLNFVFKEMCILDARSHLWHSNRWSMVTCLSRQPDADCSFCWQSWQTHFVLTKNNYYVAKFSSSWVKKVFENMGVKLLSNLTLLYWSQKSCFELSWVIFTHKLLSPMMLDNSDWRL